MAETIQDFVAGIRALSRYHRGNKGLEPVPPEPLLPPPRQNRESVQQCERATEGDKQDRVARIE